MFSKASISASRVSVYTVPTDAPEADGTFSWHSTTMVLVHIEAAGKTGLGYTYADVSLGRLVEELLKKVVHGQDAFRHAALVQAMMHEARNSGECDSRLWQRRLHVLFR
jgi:L-alanine-DL-glutamate epimerase-like enolase superfamily enzyme